MRALAGVAAVVALVIGAPATSRAVGPGDFDPAFNGGAPVVLDHQLDTRKSTHAIPAGVRADLHAGATAIGGELATLLAG
jgi:hypothetical protein